MFRLSSVGSRPNRHESLVWLTAAARLLAVKWPVQLAVGDCIEERLAAECMEAPPPGAHSVGLG